MEALPAFPPNKRHAMHFRHHSPANDFITARFPNPKVGHLSPSNVSISLATDPTSTPHHEKNASQSRQPLPRSQSSSWWMEIRKSPTLRQEPRSWKADYATIVTDATKTEPAFESDRFAVQMPTTRVPILDPPVFRAKLPSPSKAQVEAYQTYKAKAQKVREANYETGVRVPSKIVSYDYANHTCAGYNQPSERYSNPSTSPPEFEAAGAFPISPPILQHTWGSPSKQHLDRQYQRNQYKHAQVQGLRATRDSTDIYISRKPVGLENRPNNQRAYLRGDASSRANHTSTLSHTPSPEKQKIKVTLKSPTTAKKQDERTQKESWWGLYQRSPQTSTDGSRTRTPSPTKSSHSPTKLKFEYTIVPVATDPMFGCRSQDISDPLATAKVKEKAKDKVAEMPRKKEASRWAWLRPAGPRVAKPMALSSPTKPMTYVDPFIQHATPIFTQPNTPAVSPPSSPRKIIPLRPPPVIASTTSKGKFESGFAQVTSVTTLVVRICVVIYVLVGLYFILDAIRKAVHAMGAPFRAVKMVGAYVWLGVIWVAKWLGWAWGRWGIKISLKGG